MKLSFKETKITTLTKYPGEDGCTQVLKVRSLLSRTLAEKLKCRDTCFAENQVPRRFDLVKLKGTIDNCDVTLPCGNWLATVGHFSIARAKEAAKTDISLEIAYTMHFGDGASLSEWMDGQNKDEFTLTMEPPKDWDAQQELSFDETKEDGDEPEADAKEEPALASAREAAGGTPHRRRKGQLIDVTAEKA